MRPLVLPLIAAATLAAGPAFGAGLHKCTTKEGKTIYTEFECEGDAKKADVTIRESSGVDGTKMAPGKASTAAGAPKSGAAPGDGPAKTAKDPVAEAEARARALAEAEKAKQDKK